MPMSGSRKTRHGLRTLPRRVITELISLATVVLEGLGEYVDLPAIVEQLIYSLKIGKMKPYPIWNRHCAIRLLEGWVRLIEAEGWLRAVSFKYHTLPDAVFIREMIDDAPLDAVSSVSIPDGLHQEYHSSLIGY